MIIDDISGWGSTRYEETGLFSRQHELMRVELAGDALDRYQEVVREFERRFEAVMTRYRRRGINPDHFFVHWCPLP